jgi:hypothetical protein
VSNAPPIRVLAEHLPVKVVPSFKKPSPPGDVHSPEVLVYSIDSPAVILSLHISLGILLLEYCIIDLNLAMRISIEKVSSSELSAVSKDPNKPSSKMTSPPYKPPKAPKPEDDETDIETPFGLIITHVMKWLVPVSFLVIGVILATTSIVLVRDREEVSLSKSNPCRDHIILNLQDANRC